MRFDYGTEYVRTHAEGEQLDRRLPIHVVAHWPARIHAQTLDPAQREEGPSLQFLPESQ